MIEKLENFFVAAHAKRFWILGFISLLGLYCAMGFFGSLRADNQLSVWFDSKDPQLKAYQGLIDEFGNDQTLWLNLDLGPLNQEVEIQLNQTRQLIQTLQGVGQVQSIETQTFARDQGTKIREESLKQLLAQNYTLEQIRQEFPRMGNFFSTDSQHYLMLIFLEDQDLATQARLEDNIRNLLEPTFKNFILSGTPVLNREFNQLVVRDQFILFPLSVVLAFLVLLVFTRDPRACAISVGVEAALLFVLLRIAQILGYPLTIVSGLVCPLVLCVSLLNLVYLFEAPVNNLQGWAGRVSKLLKPAIYTELTTIAGFFSFGFTQIVPFNQLAVLASIGIFLALVTSLFVIPPLIGVLPSHGGKQASLDAKAKRVAMHCFLFANRYKKSVLLLTLALVIAASVGVTRLKLQTRFEGYFFADQKALQDLNLFKDRFDRLSTIDILLKGNSREWFLQPEYFKSLVDVENSLKKQTEGLASWIQGLQMVTQRMDTDKKFARVGDWDAAMIAQMNWALSSLSNDHFFVSEDGLTLRSQLNLKADTLEALSSQAQEVASIYQKGFGSSEVFVVATGYDWMLAHLHKQLLGAQKQSLFLAMGIVTLMMIFMTRQFKLGLISMIPNLLPILLTLGFMGWMGFTLDVATVLVAAIAVGVTVDDTIHLLNHFLEHKQKGASVYEALQAAQAEIGPAILKTSLILCVGFLVFALGSLKPTVMFGLVSAATFLLAMVCELVVSPALILWVHKKKGVRD